jgi:hypothetical protein
MIEDVLLSLLGLWAVVVCVRHFRRSPEERRRAALRRHNAQYWRRFDR